MPSPSPTPQSERARGAAVRRAAALVLLLAALFALPPAAEGREYANDPRIGIDEKLGATLPLDLVFRDEDGLPVRLGDLVVRPTVLTLVYYRCPGICSPLLRELRRVVDAVDPVPGVDYDLLSISFADTETPDLARKYREGLLGMGERTIPPESWRFLTGERYAIMALTDAVGFRFRKEKGEFVHAGTVIFVTRDGRIVRYLGANWTKPDDPSLLPADMELALIDATDGRARSFAQKVQRLCFGYDPDKGTYKLMVNRIVLAVTVFLVLVFLAFLLLFRRRKGPKLPASGGELATERPAT